MNPLPVGASARRESTASEFVCSPNCSIAPAALVGVFAGLALLTCAIAVAFGLMGAWMVLPFAGIEAAALAIAFVACARRAGDYERVRVGRGEVVVEFARGGVDVRRAFNPAWARLTVECTPRTVRVRLSQSGRQVELGRHLGLERRAEFAREFEAAFRAAARA